ncbi:TrbG/VirB9 family P-type conjugative transfer protein [Asticcacaulis sp.]|uniref:TrbG/VirB9 family P-type conjugative transfer protein n=1 Tax=Asticcacaulis sp. TaxID=1872648 RepID=UPI003F7B5D5E
MLTALLFLAAATPATPIPYSPPADPRIRTIPFTSDSVITVPVSRGVVTRIVLEPGERIIAAATGVPSKCENEQLQWCVVANADGNEIWVKPKVGAGRNNLELKTDRHDYSFEFVVGTAVTYRVVLTYPPSPAAPANLPPDEAALVAERMAAAQPIEKNSAYSVEANRKGADIRPAAVFDDGRFTYFRFPGNSELPTIFVIGADGKEARANFNMQGDLMVVQRLGRKFVLRLGKSVVSVWNEHYDPIGETQAEGSTVPGISREPVEVKHAS